MYYFVINITKWNNFTEHYYANVYYFNAFSNPEWFVDGKIGLEQGEKYSDTYPQLYPTTKDAVERTVINKVADNIIKENCGLATFIGVAWNGKYSKARTLAITNDKAIPLHDLE